MFHFAVCLCSLNSYCVLSSSFVLSLCFFAVCLSSLNSCCGLYSSFVFSLCFPFLRCPGLQALVDLFLEFFLFFSVRASSRCFQFHFFNFSSLSGALGEVSGVLFSALGRLLQQRLAPSILNDSTVFYVYFRRSGDSQNRENPIKRYWKICCFSELRKNRSGIDFPGFWAPFGCHVRVRG